MNRVDLPGIPCGNLGVGLTACECATPPCGYACVSLGVRSTTLTGHPVYRATVRYARRLHESRHAGGAGNKALCVYPILVAVSVRSVPTNPSDGLPRRGPRRTLLPYQATEQRSPVRRTYQHPDGAIRGTPSGAMYLSTGLRDRG